MRILGVSVYAACSPKTCGCSCGVPRVTPLGLQRLLFTVVRKCSGNKIGACRIRVMPIRRHTLSDCSRRAHCPPPTTSRKVLGFKGVLRWGIVLKTISLLKASSFGLEFEFEAVSDLDLKGLHLGSQVSLVHRFKVQTCKKGNQFAVCIPQRSQ